MDIEIKSEHVSNDWVYSNKRTGEHRWTVRECDAETIDRDETNNREEKVELKNVGMQTENNADKMYSTTEVETEINGVDSNNELTSLFTLAFNVCQKKTDEEHSAEESVDQVISGELIGSNTDVDHSATQAQNNPDMTCTMGGLIGSNTDVDHSATQDQNNPDMTCTMDVISDDPSDSIVDCNKTCKETRQSDINQQAPLPLRNQTSKKLYKCNCCNEAFTHKSKLERHLRTHTGEKPYECNLCNKAFARKGGLTYHLRTHTGEKPHECNLCNKTFAQKGGLTYHLRTHTISIC